VSAVAPVSFVKGAVGASVVKAPAHPAAPADGTWHRISSKLIPKSHFISTC
jgi:hypothetical protein